MIFQDLENIHLYDHIYILEVIAKKMCKQAQKKASLKSN